MPVFLTDFGLARNVATGSRYTRTGETLGTPAYMSPEQARGEMTTLTAASDAWGLGCVLYELLAGRPAFGGATAADVVAQVLGSRPVPLRAAREAERRDLGDLEGARADLDAALALDRRDTQALTHRGQLRALMGDLAGAADDFAAALAVAPPGWEHRAVVRSGLADARAELAAQDR